MRDGASYYEDLISSFYVQTLPYNYSYVKPLSVANIRSNTRYQPHMYRAVSTLQTRKCG